MPTVLIPDRSQTEGASDPMALKYLERFYTKARTPTKSLWDQRHKGFDDAEAGWGKGRVIDQQCGRTWLATFAAERRVSILRNISCPLSSSPHGMTTRRLRDRKWYRQLRRLKRPIERRHSCLERVRSGDTLITTSFWLTWLGVDRSGGGAVRIPFDPVTQLQAGRSPADSCRGCWETFHAESLFRTNQNTTLNQPWWTAFALRFPGAVTNEQDIGVCRAHLSKTGKGTRFLLVHENARAGPAPTDI